MYLERFHMLTVKEFPTTALLRQWSKEDFHSLLFRKYPSHENDPFFQNVSNLM